MNILLELFTSFFKIGLTTFGGGVMMVSNLKRELVDKRGYLTDDQMYDYISIAQITPGVIMVNSATLIGAKKAGFKGALVSTLAVVLPSIIIITIIGFLFMILSNLNPIFSKFLIGVRVAVCASSLSVIANMVKKNIRDIIQAIIFTLALIGSFFFSLPSAVLVIFGIVAGLALSNFFANEKKIQSSGDEDKEK